MKPSEITYRSLLVVIALVMMALPSSAAANREGERLRQTMADISLLNSQMAQRKMDAAAIREALSSRLEEIKTEALHELHDIGIKTGNEALKHPRLLYDLMLIAEIHAHIDRYTQKIGYYRVACDRLSYLYQQADDDLKIVNTLSGMKIDALLSQAEKIIDGYLPDAQTIVIQPDTLSIEPPEKVCKRLRAGR